MAYNVELSAEVDRELSTLDSQQAKRILKFLHDRVAKLDDPRSIGEALHGSRLGEFWKYRVGDYTSSARSRVINWRFWSSALDIARKSIASCNYRELRLCLNPHPCGTLIGDFVDAHWLPC